AAVGPSHYRIWHNTATCGPFGSAMAAATLFELSDDQTLDALGNAGTQSSGLWQFMETGAMSKHLHAGRACESGLIAAELAVQGFTGSPAILEGKKGLFAGMCDDPIPENILKEPESAWQLSLTSIKPWPCCRHTHPIIDCALELHQMLGDETADKVAIKTYQAALDVCDYARPENAYQARFSLYHCVAIALQDGAVKLDSFTEQARDQTRELRHATTLQVVDPFASNYPSSWGSRVRVTTSEGKILSVERKDCKGDPELALDVNEMRIKASSLMQYGGLSEAASQELCERILSLPASATPPALFNTFIDRLGL
ncbi:MAG: MmgE/PrpD family protein, partial [Proteobacteria bacterium]|nr:MmgE/PrpD family protein [Pseudomonadota bacterium]